MSRRVVRNLNQQNNVLLKELSFSNVRGRGSNAIKLDPKLDSEVFEEHFERFRHDLYIHKSINPLKTPTSRKNYYKKSIYSPTMIDQEIDVGKRLNVFLSNHEYLKLLESKQGKNFNLKLAVKLLYHEIFEDSIRSRIQMHHYLGEYDFGADNDVYSSSNEKLPSVCVKDQLSHILENPNQRIKCISEKKSILDILKMMFLQRVYRIEPQTSSLLKMLNDIAEDPTKSLHIKNSIDIPENEEEDIENKEYEIVVFPEGLKSAIPDALEKSTTTNSKALDLKNYPNSEKYQIIEKENTFIYCFDEKIEYPLSDAKSFVPTIVPVNNGKFRASITSLDQIFNVKGFAYTGKHKNFSELKELNQVPHPLDENKTVKLFHIEDSKHFIHHRNSQDQVNDVDHLIALVPCIFEADAEVTDELEDGSSKFLFNIEGKLEETERNKLPNSYDHLSDRDSIIKSIIKDLNLDNFVEIPKWSFLKKPKHYLVNTSDQKENSLCLTEYANSKEVLKGNIINLLLNNLNFNRLLNKNSSDRFILEDKAEQGLVNLLIKNNKANNVKSKYNKITTLPSLLNENLKEFDNDFNIYDLKMLNGNGDILRNAMLKVNANNEVILDDIRFKESEVEYRNHVIFMRWFKSFFSSELKKLKIDLIATLSRTSQYFEPWDYYIGHKFYSVMENFENYKAQKDIYNLNLLVETFCDEFYNRYLPLVIQELNIIKYSTGKDDRRRYKQLYLLLGNFIYHFNESFIRYKFPKLTKYYFDLSNFKVSKKFCSSAVDYSTYEMGKFYLFLSSFLRNVGIEIEKELMPDFRLSYDEVDFKNNKPIPNDKINEIMEKIELKQLVVAQMNNVDNSQKPYNSTVFFKTNGGKYRSREEAQKLKKMKARNKRKEFEIKDSFGDQELNTTFVKNSIMKNLRIQNEANKKIGFNYFDDCALMVGFDFQNSMNKYLEKKFYGNFKYYQKIFSIQQPIPIYYMKQNLMHIPHGFDLIKKYTERFVYNKQLECIITIFFIKRKNNEKYIELVKRV